MQFKKITPDWKSLVLAALVVAIFTSCFYASNTTTMPIRKTIASDGVIVKMPACFFKYNNL